MKRFLFIYLPIICIALAALLKLNSSATDNEVINQPEGHTEIDSSLSNIPVNGDREQQDEELKELKDQIQKLNKKMSDLEKEKDQLTRISNPDNGNENESTTSTQKTIVNTKTQIDNEEESSIPGKKNSSEESILSNSDEIFNFAVVENKPVYPGCENLATEDEKFMCFNQNIMKHIGREFDFPELARQMGIQGKVYVNFVIEKNGRVSNVTIARGVDKLIDDEAIRVIKLLPRFTPAIQRGKPVRMQYTVPINARLK